VNELAHMVGGDLSLTSTGDLTLSSGLTRSQERILRRLMTNPGEYIFQPNYGAGLPQFIGQPLTVAKVRGVIRSQLLLEESVSHTPEPQIDVVAIPDGIAVSIRYTDANTGAPTALSFNVTP
jgi:phage baseplate assembly protein W